VSKTTAVVCVTLLMVVAHGRPAHAQEVCNVGPIAIDVAGTSRVDAGWLSRNYWETKGWVTIPPGSCSTLDELRVTTFVRRGGFEVTGPYLQVHLTFAFTDAHGVWGPALFPCCRGAMGKSDVKLCVGGKGRTFKDDVTDSDATAGCQAYVAQASFSWFPLTSDSDVRLTVPADATAKPFGQGSNAPNPSSTPTASSDYSTALKVAAGIGALAVLGAIIERAADRSNCNTPIPKPFEPGTLNGRIAGIPVVRRTCLQADWWYIGETRTSSLGENWNMDDASLANILDPPIQVDWTASPATRATVVRNLNAMQEVIGPKRQFYVDTNGKLSYTAATGTRKASSIWSRSISTCRECTSTPAPACAP